MKVTELAKAVAWQGVQEGSSELLASIAYLCPDKEERDDFVQRICAIQHRLADLAGAPSKMSFDEIVSSTQEMSDKESARIRADMAAL